MTLATGADLTAALRDPGGAVEVVPGPLRGRIRRTDWVPVTHGVYRLAYDLPALAADLRAWQLVLPGSGAFSHLTSAQLRGWWLPPLPPDLPVFAAVLDADPRPRRRGLRVCRHTAPFDVERVAGLRVATPAETLLATARDLGLVDLLVLVDAALHRGACTVAELRSLSRRRRRGAPALRQALQYADARSESPWESLLRLLHVTCDVPVDPQVEVLDDNGVFLARADLRIRGTRQLV
ncbi:MAG: hypothetical protein M3P83_02925, partial [Actinomycetota bacterium]|nr:hypothetical protein [Actinomycetota bacterium]